MGRNKPEKKNRKEQAAKVATAVTEARTAKAAVEIRDQEPGTSSATPNVPRTNTQYYGYDVDAGVNITFRFTGATSEDGMLIKLDEDTPPEVEVTVDGVKVDDVKMVKKPKKK
ncbi:unnamed protein product [Caenorhabditis sp. 36 PRJEB53466]|nr:unnamed protein product [Caenorhabditis sp. 36 PRJEB53466]